MGGLGEASKMLPKVEIDGRVGVVLAGGLGELSKMLPRVDLREDAIAELLLFVDPFSFSFSWWKKKVGNSRGGVGGGREGGSVLSGTKLRGRGGAKVKERKSVSFYCEAASVWQKCSGTA